MGFRLIWPKRHRGSRNEHALFREMGGAFIPPSWATVVLGCGDAASGSKANMKMGQDRDTADGERRWGFVCIIARTWKTVEETTLKNLVTHLPRQDAQRTRVPRGNRKGRRTFWMDGTCLCLRHVGDVTVVLSSKGRNVGPKHTQMLVTTPPEVTPRHVVSIYQKRWAIGVSSEGHMNPFGESPIEVRSSSLVAWEAPWRESKTVKPSDTMLFGSMRKAPGCNVQ